MRIPYGFNLTALGTLEIKETEAETVCMIFDYCELKNRVLIYCVRYRDPLGINFDGRILSFVKESFMIYDTIILRKRVPPAQFPMAE